MLSWIDLLPSPFNKDPMVVLVLAPNGAKVQVLEVLSSKDIITVLELENGERMGLQVIVPVLKLWEEHAVVFSKYDIRMAPFVYSGRLSNVPQSTLLHQGMCPLVFCSKAMDVAFLNLKSFFEDQKASA